MFSARFQSPTGICVRGHQTSLEAALLDDLLRAARTHDKRMHDTKIFRGIEDLAKQHSEVDRSLQKVVSDVKARLAKHVEPEAACFEGELVTALLEGRKTVARWPVETTAQGMSLPAPFEIGGGPEGSYAVQELAADGTSVNPIQGYRVRVLSVEMDTADRLRLEEVHAEGFESRNAHQRYWINIYLENELYRWVRSNGLLVWCYEIELVSL
jgi:hypothetical protein